MVHDIAGNTVSDNNIELFSRHWPWADELMFRIVTSIVDRTILSVIFAAITGMPDLNWKFRELRGCLEEPNDDGSLYAWNVTPIFDNHTAAGWVHVAMKLSNPMLFLVVYHGYQADGTASAHLHMRGGRS